MLPLVVHLAPLAALAQPPGNYTTKETKAIKLYEDGAECMRLQKWSCAESSLKKAAAFDERFVEPRYTLAELYEMQGKDQESMAMYREALAIIPGYFPNAYLHLADIEFRNQQYGSAEQHYREFLKYEQEPVRRDRAELGIASCAFAAEAIKNPVPYEPKNLGPGVNTTDPEYYPCITADDSTLILTRRVTDPEAQPYGMQEDFFVSHRGKDGAWGTGAPVPNVNMRQYNEGAGTLTPDGRFIVFTKCAGDDGMYGGGLKGLGSCDLFISRRVGDRWSKPENLGPPVNSRAWESQPSMGSDGRTLYFVRGQRTRDGVKGMDIYVSRLQDDGAFSKPEKVRGRVNTDRQEESVQIHPDGRTLYFSSDGHPGMGGLDIFVSRLQEDSTWGKPVNLGYPINTAGDENSLLVSADGKLAYLASDRPGGFGDLDLYGFELYQQARPNAVSFVRGHVFDRDTKAPIESDVMLYDLSTGGLATAAYSDPSTGEFLVCLPTGRAYALNAGAEGYLFFSQNYDVTGEGTATRPFTLEVPMAPLKPGATIALRNVFFNTASFELLPQSHVELDKLAKLMFANPTLKIEVGGHTDNVGADADNLKLSDQRANAVRDFLVKKGIEAARITAKGYGETKPMAPNDTEEGRALNRRTEVVVQ
ncbi:MAG: OmpA family protein [Flavobacteriales bacterium]|nr:OmpA family protein [Flavobacteriales bacterium]